MEHPASFGIGKSQESKSKAADRACPERSRRECPLYTTWATTSSRRLLDRPHQQPGRRAVNLDLVRARVRDIKESMGAVHRNPGKQVADVHVQRGRCGCWNIDEPYSAYTEAFIGRVIQVGVVVEAHREHAVAGVSTAAEQAKVSVPAQQRAHQFPRCRGRGAKGNPRSAGSNRCIGTSLLVKDVDDPAPAVGTGTVLGHEERLTTTVRE